MFVIGFYLFWGKYTGCQYVSPIPQAVNVNFWFRIVTIHRIQLFSFSLQKKKKKRKKKRLLIIRLMSVYSWTS